MGKIVVLRLGHRIVRDKRLTTHVILTARAYGAGEIILSGERDDRLIDRARKFVEKWGGELEIRYEEDWKKIIREWREKGGVIVHLTVYGINLPDIIDELRRIWREKDVMVVVGSEKVPREMYVVADYNVAVSNQPHSEVAALATFLDWLQEGRELTREFKSAELRIIPQKCGKKVIRIEQSEKDKDMENNEDS
ncbi:MAG: tRNA (cytidine(56)-2'-O)-methyltransferase [Aigarchaeota archaeon]|nr:tRNA (cytidine(56)-2'-O)-methyltransferase [Aigarchaeota archaeon]MCX8192270.1 tRNA (cytidine(56)-2'-O)-methyltransferase [Nitrososphaeria archaeon]MDW7986122.1 tRNA (cytidine(56)-2'-O)-methyltransferase [Nitrososphaerota archaeon]